MQPDDPVVVYDDEHYYMTNATAAHFARLGNEVTLVTPQPYFAELMGYTLEQPCVSKQLAGLGVKIACCAVTMKYDGALYLQNTNSRMALDRLKKTLDSFELRAPNLALWVTLEGRLDKTLLGDAEAPGIVQSAVFGGHKATLKFLKNGVEPTLKREREILFLKEYAAFI